MYLFYSYFLFPGTRTLEPFFLFLILFQVYNGTAFHFLPQLQLTFKHIKYVFHTKQSKLLQYYKRDSVTRLVHILTNFLIRKLGLFKLSALCNFLTLMASFGGQICPQPGESYFLYFTKSRPRCLQCTQRYSKVCTRLRNWSFKNRIV